MHGIYSFFSKVNQTRIEIANKFYPFSADACASPKEVTAFSAGQQSEKLMFNYVRTFLSQMGNHGTFHNCWACSVNAIKSRGPNDMRCFEKIKKLAIPGFNDLKKGIDLDNLGKIFSEFEIGSIKVNLKHFFDDEFHLELAQYIHMERNDLSEKSIQKVLEFFSHLLSNFGPILMLRAAVAGSHSVHAVALIDMDIENRKFLIFNSMEKTKNVLDIYRFITFDFYFWLKLIADLNSPIEKDSPEFERLNFCQSLIDSLQSPALLHYDLKFNSDK